MIARSARHLAYTVLLDVERDGAYSSIALNTALGASSLKNEEKAFSSSLVYGVCERKLTLDYNISLYLNRPLNKLKKNVLTILRLGAYQIFFMDSVPSRAAVSESVRLTKELKLDYSSSLVNAVLRRCAEFGLKLLNGADSRSLSVEYSCNEDIIELLIRQYGVETTREILSKSLEVAGVFVRVNTLKTTAEQLIERLASEGVRAKKSTVKNCLFLDLNSASIRSLASFGEGLFHAQDISSQRCVALLDAKPGEIVFDLCSAPGGKAFTVAQEMQNEGRIFAFDVHEHRVKLIRDGAKRLSIDIIDAKCANATDFDRSLPVADRVLCDVPCSGLGVISRKPEIKYKHASDFVSLAEIQLKILETGAAYLKTGGTLIYSTCTLNKDENEAVVERFLKMNKNFAFDSSRIECGFKTYLPHIDGGDGFFVASIIKTNE